MHAAGVLDDDPRAKLSGLPPVRPGGVGLLAPAWHRAAVQKRASSTTRPKEGTMITIQLHGGLTRDPELRELGDGTKLAALRIAANDSRGRVVYLNCAEFGKSGEATARTLSTGSEVVFYGELRFREVDGDNGRREYYWPSAKRVRRPPQQRARRPTARPRTPMTFRSEPNGRATTSVSPR